MFNFFGPFWNPANPLYRAVTESADMIGPGINWVRSLKARGSVLSQAYHAGASIFTQPGSTSESYHNYRAQGYTHQGARSQIVLNKYGRGPRQGAFEETKEGIFKQTSHSRISTLESNPVAPHPVGIGKAYDFFTRSPQAHITKSWAPAWNMTKGALRDASGVAFFQGAYHRVRSRMFEAGTWERKFHTLRGKGFTSIQARQELWKDFEKQYGRLPRGIPSLGPRLAKNFFRQGWVMGGVALYASAQMAMSNSHGPLIGFPMAAAAGATSAFAGRVGWSLGAAAGRAATSGLTRMAGTRLGLGAARLAMGAATAGGAIIGGGLGMIVLPMVLEEAVDKLPGVGFRMSRRGFGNLYGPYRDAPQAATMRQAALAAMSQSQMNARNALGGEAALLHLT